MVTKFVDGAPFQTSELPHTKPKAIFQPKTAAGKLKAVMIPTTPRGFHYSIMKWLGLSDGMTSPYRPRDKPHAISHMSIIS